MKSYECIAIFRPTSSDDELKSSTAKYARVIADKGGEITRLEGWGKRRLAYEIDDHIEGHYFLYRFRSDSVALNELTRQLKIDEAVIRHMVVVDELAAGNEPKIDPDNLELSERQERETEEAHRGEGR